MRPVGIRDDEHFRLPKHQAIVTALLDLKGEMEGEEQMYLLLGIVVGRIAVLFLHIGVMG
jgi:hypothetical protein